MKITSKQLRNIVFSVLDEARRQPRLDPKQYIPAMTKNRQARNTVTKLEPDLREVVGRIGRELTTLYYDEGRKAAGAQGPGHVVHVDESELDRVLPVIISGYEGALDELSELPHNALVDDACEIIENAIVAFHELQAAGLSPNATARAMRQIHIYAMEKRWDSLFI